MHDHQTGVNMTYLTMKEYNLTTNRSTNSSSCTDMHFLLNKVITCDDRDQPWINDNIKNKIKWKNTMYKNYKRNGKKTEDYELLIKTVSEVSQLIEESKDEYYYRLGKRLNDPSTSAKSYWTIFKTFYNKRMIPLIPPLLVNNSFVTDFKEKTNLFNKCFLQTTHTSS